MPLKNASWASYVHKRRGWIEARNIPGGSDGENFLQLTHRYVFLRDLEVNYTT